MNAGAVFSLGPVVAAAVCAFTLPAFSQVPVITSLSQNGALVCSNLPAGTLASVEWSSLTNQWQDLQSVTVQPDGTIQVSVPMTHTGPMFFRVRGTNPPTEGQTNMVLIPAGSFQMGDSFSEGYWNELPVHTVYVSAFYMDKYEVTKALWDEVHNWATNHGYVFDYGYFWGKTNNHPETFITWYEAVKWCNARSEKEGKMPAYYTDSGLTQPYRTGQAAPYVNWNTGYRLPTEAEWEKAARGGAAGWRFAWSGTDTISHSRANYNVCLNGSENYYSYDVSPTAGYHPAFNDGVRPYTSPVGYFPPNGYGLYDMTGNVLEWCWDWYGAYPSESQSDPRGPSSGTYRMQRGGCWSEYAVYCPTAHRNDYDYPTGCGGYQGFRTVLPAGQ